MAERDLEIWACILSKLEVDLKLMAQSAGAVKIH